MLGRLLVTALVLGATSCGIDKFETTITDQATIPGTYMGGRHDVPYGGAFKELKLEADKEFTNQGVKPSDVDRITLQSVRIESGDPGVLSMLSTILDSVELHVSAPGLEKKKIASISPVPAAASADLVIEPGFDLKPYATAPSMSISAAVQLKKQPLFNVVLKTTVTLLVDVNLL